MVAKLNFSDSNDRRVTVGTQKQTAKPRCVPTPFTGTLNHRFPSRDSSGADASLRMVLFTRATRELNTSSKQRRLSRSSHTHTHSHRRTAPGSGSLSPLSRLENNNGERKCGLHKDLEVFLSKNETRRFRTRTIAALQVSRTNLKRRIQISIVTVIATRSGDADVSPLSHDSSMNVDSCRLNGSPIGSLHFPPSRIPSIEFSKPCNECHRTDPITTIRHSATHVYSPSHLIQSELSESGFCVISHEPCF